MNWAQSNANRRSVLKGIGGMMVASSAIGRAEEPPQAVARSAEFVYPAGEQAYRTQLAPRPVWPNGARTVMTIQVHTDGPGLELGSGHNAQGIWGWGYYPLRAGVERQIEMFASEDVKITFCVPGYDTLIRPEIYKKIVAAGHEICMHGFYHLRNEGKLEDLKKTHKLIADLTGVAPVGLSAPGGYKDPTTLAVLRELGCIYDASEKDDDHPYLATIDGEIQKNLVILPNYTQTLDDAKQYAGEQTQAEVLEEWSTELDTLHASTGYYPFMYHADSGWGTGTPDRTWGVSRAVIRKAKAMPGVKIMTMREVAEMCLAHPAPFRVHTGDNTRKA